MFHRCRLAFDYDRNSGLLQRFWLVVANLDKVILLCFRNASENLAMSKYSNSVSVIGERTGLIVKSEYEHPWACCGLNFCTCFLEFSFR